MPPQMSCRCDRFCFNCHYCVFRNSLKPEVLMDLIYKLLSCDSIECMFFFVSVNEFTAILNIHTFFFSS